MKNYKKGFTLIEILVVIVIIAILAGLILIRIGSASKDARESKRKSDIAQIQEAIRIFEANGGKVKHQLGFAVNLTAAKVVGVTIEQNLDSFGKSVYDYLIGGNYPNEPLYERYKSFCDARDWNNCPGYRYYTSSSTGPYCIDNIVSSTRYGEEYVNVCE